LFKEVHVFVPSILFNPEAQVKQIVEDLIQSLQVLSQSLKVDVFKSKYFEVNLFNVVPLLFPSILYN